MTTLCIDDLNESKTLDRQALGRVRGGHSYAGGGLVDIEEILREYLGSSPEYPMPQIPCEPAVPVPYQPIPFGGPGPADEF